MTDDPVIDDPVTYDPVTDAPVTDSPVLDDRAMHSPAADSHSRLVRYLRQLAVSDTDVEHRHLAERLGRMLDLSYSITLAEALRGLPQIRRAVADAGMACGEAESAVREEFMRERRAMIGFIGRSFAPGTAAIPFRLPRPLAESLSDSAAGFVPYQRFYSLHQSEMDARIHRLRQRVRQVATRHSDALAQLAALDSTLSETLAGQTRKAFAAVPRLLARHFQALAQRQQQEQPPERQEPSAPEHWTAPGAWLDHFYRDMQGLLLAELELRLQPVIGLLEAIAAAPVSPVSAHNPSAPHHKVATP